MKLSDQAKKHLKLLVRALGIIVLLMAITGTLALSKLLVETADTFSTSLTSPPPKPTDKQPFPLGVNPATKTITENPNVEQFLQIHYATEYQRTKNRVTWLSKVYERVAYLPWYQSLASPNSRILVIFAGQRKEEVAISFGKILGWNRAEREQFIALVTKEPIELADGTLFPDKYVVTADATPEQVSRQVQTAFIQNVLARYPKDSESIIPLSETLTIASLIEREAGSFQDMQAVSGVIWNRLFLDMRLQLDASLQYARGSRAYEPWWPVPVPRDKYIDSPFNTYKYDGLPPSPIASPSAAAIIAALNPLKTDCLFYFHDDVGKMHCATTYEDHVKNLKALYGRGR